MIRNHENKIITGRLLQDNQRIKELLYAKIYSLDLTMTEVIQRAEFFDYTNLHSSKLSRYFNNTDNGGLTDTDILFLCALLGVEISIDVSIRGSRRKHRLDSDAKAFVKQLEIDKLK